MILNKEEKIHMQWETSVFTYGSARQPPELQHYGIPKMRWGERRFQYKNGTLTPEGRERYRKSSGSDKSKSSERYKGSKALRNQDAALKDLKNKSKNRGLTKGTDKEEARQKQNGKDRKDWKAKDVSDLSDEELRRRNNRLEAEQKYKNSTTPQWKKDAKQWGKEAVKAILVTAVVSVLTESFKESLKPIVKNKMNEVFNKASKKSLSSLNSAKRKSAPYLASMLMQKDLMKDRFKKR